MNIQPVKFDGFDAIEITTAGYRLVAVTEFGPRIAFFGKPGGDNLFYWEKPKDGYREFKLYGGHRVWVTRPGADESEEAYMGEPGPCEVQIGADQVTINGAPHHFVQVRRGLRIRPIDDTTVAVTGLVRNEGAMLYSAGVWSLTCTNPAGGKEYGIPLFSPNGIWEVANVVYPRRWAGHTSRPDDPQITMNSDFMIVRPQGVESKRALRTEPGILAMTWPEKRLSFIKRSPFNPQGSYPLGCNLSFYIGPSNFMVEMETMGEERTILPGETAENTEVWKLVDEAFDWTKPQQLIDLVK